MYQRTTELGCCAGSGVCVHMSEGAMCDNRTHHLYQGHLCKCTSRGSREYKGHTHLTTCPHKSCLRRSKESPWQHQRMWKLLWMPTTAQGQRAEALPSHNPFPKTSGSSDDIEQWAPHPLLPTHCLRQAGTSTRDCLWWELFMSSKTLWAFRYLKI